MPGIALLFLWSLREYVFNTFCWGWRIGYHFYESKSDAQGNGANGPAGACNGNFVGIGADMVAISVLVEATQPYGLLITNGEFTAFQPGRAGKVDVSNITDVPTTVLVTPGYTGGVAAPSNLPCNKFCGVKVSFVNCAFWGSNDVKANISTSYEHAVVDFKDSSFFDWDLHHNDSYAIVAEDSGSITVTGCEFRQDAPQVLIGPNVRRAVVTGNLYEGLQRIDVQGGERDEVVVANNAGADFKGKRQLQRAARIY